MNDFNTTYSDTCNSAPTFVNDYSEVADFDEHGIDFTYKELAGYNISGSSQRTDV